MTILTRSLIESIPSEFMAILRIAITLNTKKEINR
jgi:hypothetical protein